MTAAVPAPRRLPLRFSLRVLLLAVTAFAVGFPIWYRWPYEEEVDVLPTPGMRRVITWQRQWGGGRSKHGRERLVYGQDSVAVVRNYRNAVLHGPYLTFFSDGSPNVSGQFVGGLRDGEWAEWLDGRKVSRTHWFQGHLEGVSEQLSVDEGLGGKGVRLAFSAGRLTKIDDRWVEDRLAQLVASGAIDNSAIVKNLAAPDAVLDGGDTIGQVAANLQYEYEVPVMIEYRHVDPHRTVAVPQWRGIPLSAAISATLGMHDLSCDYRYGCIWVTSAEDAKDWHDPTGVAQIIPPKNSPLAQSWNEPVNVQALEQPLGEVIDALAGRLAISANLSQITPDKESDPAHLVTFSVQGHPFQHALGILLYKTGCRCKLEAETLVILPPEEMP